MLVYERGLHPSHSHCYKSSPDSTILIYAFRLKTFSIVYLFAPKSSDQSFNTSSLVFYDELLISWPRSVNKQINGSFMIILQIKAIRHL